MTIKNMASQGSIDTKAPQISHTTAPKARKRSSRLFLLLTALLIFSGCKNDAFENPFPENETSALVQETEAGKQPSEVSFEKPQSPALEAQPSQAIEDLAVQVFSIEASLGENFYQYAQLDLNGDGLKETMVWLYGANFSSGQGDAIMILRSDGELLQAFHALHTPVTVSSEPLGSYRSFYVYSENGKYARFDFSHEYPDSAEMACEVPFEAIRGVTLFEGHEEDPIHPLFF